MNEEEVNLEIKLIEFRKQKFLENEILERAKKKMEELEKHKREEFRKKIKYTYEIFVSSFKYSLPIGIPSVVVMQSLVAFPVVHFGIFFMRLGRNASQLQEKND
jgi:hypothetical protein